MPEPEFDPELFALEKNRKAHLKTIRNPRWFEIARTSGHIEDGKVRHFQATLKVGFTIKDAS
jgi:flavin-binding protein dodecin